MRRCTALFSHLQVGAGDAQIEPEAYGEWYQLSGVDRDGVSPSPYVRRVDFQCSVII